MWVCLDRSSQDIRDSASLAALSQAIQAAKKAGASDCYQLLRDAANTHKEVNLEVCTQNLEDMVTKALEDSSVTSEDLLNAIRAALDAGISEETEIYLEAGKEHRFV